ncbi:Inositol 3-kinase [Parasponia andersonii]|uniref:Inositol 3-kinase n=1 Tax=Parasponia andersonii TaxID=3476 RepID=A0A2P5CPM3_PARAD|nr:Inositol 3-kinase [Parasponia andersonii]
MVRDQKFPQSRGLIVGNYCHDVLIRDGVVVAETLGGAASFISAVLDGLTLRYKLASKVGRDFAYSTHHDPIVVPGSRTTMFHAYFDSEIDGDGHQDRVLKRARACDPIWPSDLPESRFDFGMAVGVGGEILPETLEKMLDLCDTVSVDIQALIRSFDAIDGTVKLVDLKESGFFHLLPRIGFLKASGEETSSLDIEEVRKLCCVVVTNGKHGCTVYWKAGEVQIGPFPTNQIDPTGAGDSFLGGFVAGLVQGLPVPDAALLGNLFGSLAVGHIGVPKFDLRLLQRVKDEVQRRKMQCISFPERKDDELNLMKLPGFEQFHASLSAAKILPTSFPVQECQWDLSISPPTAADQPKLLTSCVFEETIQTIDSKP